MELNWKLSTAGDLSYVNAELLSRWRPIAWYDKAKNWPWISAKLIASKLLILAILETQKPPKPTETLRILPKPTKTHRNPSKPTETSGFRPGVQFEGVQIRRDIAYRHRVQSETAFHIFRLYCWFTKLRLKTL